MLQLEIYKLFVLKFFLHYLTPTPSSPFLEHILFFFNFI